MAGGKRKGAGRPKGSKGAKTLEKEVQLERVRQRVFSATDRLLNAQLSLAQGVSYLYKIEKRKVVGPKGGITWMPEKPKIVTSTWEIESYLEGLLDESDIDSNEPGATYYYITTEKPENQAIKDMFDRVYGKPIETLEATVTNTLKVDV